jgi:PAS domain S-box-containing protein
MSNDLAYGILGLRERTRRRQAEETLRASEDKFAKAFHTSPDAININRLSDGLFIEINSGFTEITGYTLDDVQDKTSLDIEIWADLADRERLVTACFWRSAKQEARSDLQG